MTTSTADLLSQQIKNHFSPIALHFTSESTLFLKSYLKNHSNVHHFLDLSQFASEVEFVQYLERHTRSMCGKVVLLWNVAFLFHNESLRKTLFASVLKTLKHVSQALILCFQCSLDEKLFENYFVPYHMYFSWVERENLIMRVVCSQQRDINSKRITKRRYMRFPETKSQELQWLEDYAEVQTLKSGSTHETKMESSAVQKERQQQKQDSLDRVQMDSTFNLETSDKEAKQRDSLVLPHQRIGHQKTVAKVRSRGGMIHIENEDSDEDSDFDSDEEPDDDEEL